MGQKPLGTNNDNMEFLSAFIEHMLYNFSVQTLVLSVLNEELKAVA